MFAALRSLAPAVLLIAWLSGQTAMGFVLEHVAREHAGAWGHVEHHASDPHAVDPGVAEHLATHHHADAEGGHADAAHGPEHTHQFLPATAAAPARIASPSIDVDPCLAPCGSGRFDPAPRSARSGASTPAPSGGPAAPQRHAILRN